MLRGKGQYKDESTVILGMVWNNIPRSVWPWLIVIWNEIYLNRFEFVFPWPLCVVGGLFISRPVGLKHLACPPTLSLSLSLFNIKGGAKGCGGLTGPCNYSSQNHICLVILMIFSNIGNYFYNKMLSFYYILYWQDLTPECVNKLHMYTTSPGLPIGGSSSGSIICWGCWWGRG